MNKIKATLFITETIHKQVKTKAKENGLTASAYIEQVLRRDLSANK